MPSASKKRKAAKKKKEQQTLNDNSNNSSSISDTHPQGNDDPKSQDERDSDGGELESQASEDNQNQHRSLNEQNEESEKRPASQDYQNRLPSSNEGNEECGERVQSTFVTENKPIDVIARDEEESQKTVVEDESIVKIEREVNFKQDIESLDINVELFESAKDLHEGDGKSSSSSRSDDESRASDKKWEAEAHNSAVDTITYHNVEDENPQEVKGDTRIEKPLIEANGDSVMETTPAIDSVTSVVPMSEVGRCVIEGAQFPNPDVLDVVEPGLKANEDKLSPKPKDVAAGLVQEENEEKAFPVLDKNAGAGPSKVVGASNLNGNEDEMLKSSSAQTAFEENVKDSEHSDANVIKNEGKTLASSGAHTSEANKDVDKPKGFEASEYNETQPLVPAAPQIAQRTSWISCCGLFDVLTGSNR